MWIRLAVHLLIKLFLEALKLLSGVRGKLVIYYIFSRNFNLTVADYWIFTDIK